MVVKMKAIIPADPAVLKIGKVRLEVLNTMRKMGTQVRRDFAKTTDTWKNKPRFEQSVSLKAPGPTLTVWTDNLIYFFLNDGTKEHPISAKNAPVLAFKTSFFPKTFPGVIGSVRGGSFAPWGHAKEVIHPGTEPREWAETIKDKWQPKFTVAMDAAIKKAVKAYGQAI